MNKKVYIKQDGTIPGHRIVEELERRGAEFYDWNFEQAGSVFFIDEKSMINFQSGECLDKYTELLYNKETDSFYENIKIEKGKYYLCISQYMNCIEGRIYLALDNDKIVDDFGTEYIMNDKAGLHFKHYRGKFKIRGYVNDIATINEIEVNLLNDSNPSNTGKDSQRMKAGEAKEALLPNKSTLSEKEKETIREKITYVLPEIESFAIPEGYEATIEDGKVIVRKKKWKPSAHETFFMVASMCDYPHFIVEDCDWVGDDQDYVKLDHNNVFHTEEEAQAFCMKLNNAISPILEERRKEVEK